MGFIYFIAFLSETLILFPSSEIYTLSLTLVDVANTIVWALMFEKEIIQKNVSQMLIVASEWWP